MNPLPREIERKYLIKRPSAETLSELPDAAADEIAQTYLTPAENGAMRRVRKRGAAERGYKYYYTEKIDVSFGERIELEHEITEEEYSRLLPEADPDRSPIEKTRVCFKWSGRLFELDIYPFSEQYATLEIELDDINEQFALPDPIVIIRDVTGDKRYVNSTLAYTKKLAPPEQL